MRKIIKEAMEERLAIRNETRKQLNQIMVEHAEQHLLAVKGGFAKAGVEVYRTENDLPPCPPICPTLKELHHV